MGKRALLLPPYLDTNSVWVDYVSAVDTILYDKVDQHVNAIKNLRQQYVIPYATEDNQISLRQIFDSVSQLDIFEREVLIRQLNLLGLTFKNTDLFDDNDLQRLVRNLGRFWYSKGTFNFIDFIGYCIDADLSMVNLWAKSKLGVTYDVFAEEGSAQLVDTVLQGFKGVGSRAYTPHNNKYHPTSTVLFEWFGQVNNWAPGYRQSLISKWDGTINQRQFIFRISQTGTLQLVWSTDGVTANTFDSGVAVTTRFANGAKAGFSALFTLNDGAGNCTCQFYTKDQGNPWLELSTLKKIVGVTTVFNATSVPLEIITTNQGTQDNLTGTTLRAAIRVDGDLKADFQSNIGKPGDTSLTDALANVWTIGSPAVLVNASDFTPIWAGGMWFPSTHVRVSFDAIKFAGISVNSLAQFFNDFANYNLVLADVTQESSLYVAGTDSPTIADIVAMAFLFDTEVYIPDYELSFATYLLLLANGAFAFVDTANSPSNSVTGDIDIRAKVAPNTWASGAVQSLVFKEDAGANKVAYGFEINTTGGLRFVLSDAGNTITNNYDSSVAVPYNNGDTVWLRATRVQSTGVVQFFTSVDGIIWTQLGTNLNSTVGLLYDATSEVDIGYRSITAQQQFTGKVYYAEVRNGINGSRVLTFDPTDTTPSTTTFTSSLTQETWIVNGNATLV